MNIITHPVAPEEVMAFLDGELSALEAQTVSTHIEQCGECTRVATQFRKTSEDLAAWPVASSRASWDDFLVQAASIDSRRKITRVNKFVRRSSWTWKQWAMASGATMAVLILFVGISLPTLHLSREAATSASAALREQQAVNESTASSLGRLHINGTPTTDQKSEVQLNQVVTQGSPGSAADSNGLYHGLGNYDENLLPAAPGPPPPPGPMIARTVSLTIVAKDFAVSRSSLDAILARHHGYSAQLNISTAENAPRSLQASLRIPADEVSSAVADLRALGRVENESQSGEEVTQQHADLVARLKNSRETEQRLSAILQQRTGKVSDVLQVEQEIARVRGDIEQMEAQQKALEHRVDFATVELQLAEEYKAQLNSPVPSVSTRILNSFVAGVRNASETAVGIVLVFGEYGPALLIWSVILALPVVLVWRRYKRKLATV
ncbi:MAG: DUF4349 domain-containing protein [Candidatus Acidiferrales bacterium]